MGISMAGIVSASQPSFADIAGTVAPGQLPAPTLTALGGVQASSGAANQWVAAISTAGVPVMAQPAFSNLSGTVARLNCRRRR